MLDTYKLDVTLPIINEYMRSTFVVRLNGILSLFRRSQRMRGLNGSSVVYYREQSDGLVFKPPRRFITCKVNLDNLVILQGDDDCTPAESFFKVIAPVLIAAQCFFLMPVYGITAAHPDLLRFQWYSFRTLLALVYIIFALIMAILELLIKIKNGLTPRTVVSVVFYSCAANIGILFFHLARNWPEMAKMWHMQEAFLLKSPYKMRGPKLSHRIGKMMALILLAAFVEHLLYLSAQVYTTEQKAMLCGVTYESLWEFFFVARYGAVFELIPYNVSCTLVLEFYNFLFTFAWNYIDLFLIVQNMALTLRFQQLNDQLLRFRGRAMYEVFWTTTRLHFVALCELLEYLDRKLGPVILFSCFNNLYYICLQLLNVFNKLPNTISYIYFWYSLLFLIGRTACVFFTAASTNDIARRMNNVLKDVPTGAMCLELERFVLQARSELIALSGMKLFYMTRSTVLNVAVTIFTYELTMMQLDREFISAADSDFCA